MQQKLRLPMSHDCEPNRTEENLTVSCRIKSTTHLVQESFEISLQKEIDKGEI